MRNSEMVPTRTNFDEEAIRVGAKIPAGVRVAVIGSTSFWHADSEQTCTEIGGRLAGLENLILLTGGVSGVGECIGRGYVKGCRALALTRSVIYVLPRGCSAWDYGTTLFAGDGNCKRDLTDGTWVSSCSVPGPPSTLRDYLLEREIRHTRSRPYHPMTQGKIERYHRSLKNVVTLRDYYLPWQLKEAIAAFVRYYNHERVHESLHNLTPGDVYLGRAREIRTARERLKEQTLRRRRRHNQGLPPGKEEFIRPSLYREAVSQEMSPVCPKEVDDVH